jgi:hypothetical protein
MPRSVRESLKPDHLGAAKGKKVNERYVELNATPASGRSETNEGDGKLTDAAYLFDFNIDLCPRFDERLPEAADTVMPVISSVRTWKLRTTSERPLDLRVKHFEHLIELPLVPGCVGPANDLDVLLRHCRAVSREEGEEARDVGAVELKTASSRAREER